MGALATPLAGQGLPGRGVCPPSLRALPPTSGWRWTSETTSLNPAQAEIVSIGAVRIRGNRIETGDALSLRVQAPASLSAQSVVIHGLRHRDLQQGMTLEAALRQLLAFIGPRELVGYPSPMTCASSTWRVGGCGAHPAPAGP